MEHATALELQARHYFLLNFLTLPSPRNFEAAWLMWKVLSSARAAVGLRELKCERGYTAIDLALRDTRAAVELSPAIGQF